MAKTRATIDFAPGKTHLTGMGIEITMSSKGQIVIPKDVRDALGLKPGERLMLERVGQRIIIETPQPAREKISYEEFRRRMPVYTGPPVAIEDMTVDWEYMARNRDQDAD